MDDILLAASRARQLSPYRTILLKEYRPELAMAILIPFFQQWTGINAIMFYMAPLFKTLGFGQSAALYNAVITGGVNVVATLVSIFLVDRIGRKALFIEGGCQMMISQVTAYFPYVTDPQKSLAKIASFE